MSDFGCLSSVGECNETVEERRVDQLKTQIGRRLSSDKELEGFEPEICPILNPNQLPRSSTAEQDEKELVSSTVEPQRHSDPFAPKGDDTNTTMPPCDSNTDNLGMACEAHGFGGLVLPCLLAFMAASAQ